MILLTVTEDLTSIATLLQVILAIGTLALIWAQFGLQAGIFKMQQKITETQLKQAEIDAKTYRLIALEHTNRIKPKFIAEQTRCQQQVLKAGSGVKAIFELELKFTNNLNIAKDIKFNVKTAEGDNWAEIGQSFEKPIIHPGQHFDFQARFSDRDENVGCFCEGHLEKLNEVSDWVEQYKQFWEARFDSLDNYLKELQSKKKKNGKKK